MDKWRSEMKEHTEKMSAIGQHFYGNTWCNFSFGTIKQTSDKSSSVIVRCV